MKIIGSTIALSIIGIVSASYNSPVNEVMISSIQAKNPNWQVADPKENPLSQYTHEELLGMLGTYIVPSNRIYRKTKV